MREGEVRRPSRRLQKVASVWRRDADLAHKVDSHEELRQVSGLRLVALAFSTLGVVFGDIGTSPLYTYTTVYSNLDATDKDVVLGVFSMVFWTLTLLCGVQYVVILLQMDDNGEGGTFALYALICRATNIRAGGRIHETEMGLSGFDDDAGDEDKKRPSVAQRMRRALASSRALQRVLLCTVMLAACLVLADGILTPSISVVSAIQGLQLKVGISNNAVAGISIAILVALFAIQPFGTARVSSLFAPFLLLWFVCNAAIGIFNIAKYDPGVFKGISPYYVYRYWSGNAHEGWLGMGSIFLSITGCEALYADLGHFNAAAIRLSFLTVVYPSLILGYLGQTAFLLQTPVTAGSNVFWLSVPTPVFWPMLVIGTIAAIVASQALITGSYTIAQQAVSHNVFPRLTIKHTNAAHRGQIYVPQVNWTLMIGCVAVVAIFKTGESLGNAYGLAVVMVMCLSTVLAAVCMLLRYSMNPLLVTAYFLIFIFMEASYLSSNMIKVPKGAWFPLAVCSVLFFFAFVWYWGQTLKNSYIAANKQKLGELLLAAPAGSADAGHGGGGAAAGGGAPATLPSQPERPRRGGQGALRLSDGTPVSRIPGVGIYFSELLDGVPPVMTRFLTAIPSVHDMVVLLTVRQVPVPHVLPEESLLIRKLALPSFYHAVVRCGYMDEIRFDKGFEDLVTEELLAYLSDDVRGDAKAEASGDDGGHGLLLARLALPRSATFSSRRAGRSASVPQMQTGAPHASQVAIDLEPKSLPGLNRPLRLGAASTATLMSFNRRDLNSRPALPPPSAFAVQPEDGVTSAGDKAAAVSSARGGMPWVQQPSVYRRVRNLAASGDGVGDGQLSCPPSSSPRPPLPDSIRVMSVPLPAAAAHPELATVLEGLDLEKASPKGAAAAAAAAPEPQQDAPQQRRAALEEPRKRLFRALTVSSTSRQEGAREQEDFAADRERLRAARERGVYFLVGKSKLGAAEGRGLFTRFLLQGVYNAMVDNVPATTDVYHVPTRSMLEMTVTYLV